GGFDQCYNAQAAVAAGSLLVVAGAVSQAPNDKQQLEPMLDKIEALPDELGKPECLLADTGYFSAANVAACEKAGIEPLIAMGRQPHHPPSAERFEAAPEAPEDPTPVEAMAHRLKTPAGRALYALRKQMPEPVCECAPNRDPTAECANHLTRNTNSTPREGSCQMQNETPQELMCGSFSASSQNRNHRLIGAPPRSATPSIPQPHPAPGARGRRRRRSSARSNRCARPCPARALLGGA